ncbi:MAG: hypothetical protein ACL93V_16845 [Candidatus Electrothrix sp. YB6]
MNIIKIGISVAACVALSGCSDLLLLRPEVKGCYPVDSLSIEERVSLQVGNGNPILLAGDKEFVCACYHPGSLVAADEGDHLDRADEDDNLDRADENDNLDRADEGDYLVKADEGDRLDRASEGDRLDKAGEGDRLDRASEGDRLDKAGEGDRLDKAGEGDQLDKADEADWLSKDSTELSCRIVSGCPGFQLIGYEPKQITVRTEEGRKSFSTNCITW